jgi:hypothetical protein
MGEWDEVGEADDAAEGFYRSFNRNFIARMTCSAVLIRWVSLGYLPFAVEIPKASATASILSW